MDPNTRDEHGQPALTLALRGEAFPVAEALLASPQLDVNATNAAGETPLILAVHRRDLPMLRTLLAAGASPDRSDNSGRTARDYAKLEGFAQALEEFDKSAKGKTRKSGQTYGPSL